MPGGRIHEARVKERKNDMLIKNDVQDDGLYDGGYDGGYGAPQQGYAKPGTGFAQDTAAKQRKRPQGGGRSPQGQGTQEQAPSSGSQLKAILIPLILAAAAVLFLYIAIQTSIEAKYVRKPLVMTSKALDAGTHITKDNIDKYFSEATVESSMSNGDTYGSLSDMPDDFYIKEEIPKGRVVYSDDITESLPSLAKYGDGAMETSVSIGNIESSIAGRIRAGDVVNVYAFSSDSNAYVLALTDVYIERAYTSDGTEITAEAEKANGTMLATLFTVLVTPEEEDVLNAAIATGDIQLYMAGPNAPGSIAKAMPEAPSGAPDITTGGSGAAVPDEAGKPAISGADDAGADGFQPVTAE